MRPSLQALIFLEELASVTLMPFVLYVSTARKCFGQPERRLWLLMSMMETHTQAATLQALMFLEELASVMLTPFVLYVSLPKCAPAILAFVRDFTVHVDGIGDICSLAAFDLQRHGNAKYGAPVAGAQGAPPPRVTCAFPACYSLYINTRV